MGRNSGGAGHGGLGVNDSTGKGIKLGKVYSLKTIEDPKMYREISKAIGRYDAVFGIRDREVKLADMPASYNGLHVTENGVSKGVFLNRKQYQKAKPASVVASKREAYKTGWATETNKPIAHTITHELAHATWNSHLSAPNAQAATPAIRKLYDSWARDKKKKGYGTYAHTNINEFWAETATKAVHGKQDKYTKAVKSIVRKYKL